MSKKHIIQVFGPTGVGKSSISVKIAKLFNCEIISADSMQVYKEFNIGTDKITVNKMEGIKHHLIDFITDCSQFNASKFLDLSFQKSEEILKKGKLPLLCGGTPFYHRVVKNGIFPEKENEKDIREELKNKIELEGSEIYWKKLNKLDPLYAKKISKNDKIRIVRALEIYQVNKIIPSEIFKLTKTPFNNYNFIRIGLNMDRKELYNRINRRVDEMIDNGLIDEVKYLKNKYNLKCPPFNSLGYKESLMILNNEVDLKTGIELIKQHSRNYAKRQLSWFRGEKEVEWFEPNEIDSVIKYISNKLKNKNICLT